MPYVKIGWRTIKSFVAVYLCCIVSYFMNISPSYAIIAALLCIKPTQDESLRTGAERIAGTFVGSFFALMFLYIEFYFFPDHLLWRYTLLSLGVFPIILSTLAFKQPEISSFSCVVYFVLVLSHQYGESPMEALLMRIVMTILGVLIALAVNVLIAPRE